MIYDLFTSPYYYSNVMKFLGWSFNYHITGMIVIISVGFILSYFMGFNLDFNDFILVDVV